MSKYVIEDTTLTAIADAVREKSGTSELILVSELPTAIAGIEAGGGSGDAPTAEELTFSGSLSNAFINTTWNWFLEKYKDDITFQNVTSSQNMFANNPSEDFSYLTIPFNNNANLQSMFSSCSSLAKLPKVSGAVDRYLYNLFGSCMRLPSDEINNFLTSLTIYAASTSLHISSLFSNCYSARELTPALEWLHTQLNTSDTLNLSNLSYANCWYYCYALDTLENVPVVYRGSASTTRTSNAFSSTFNYCCRAKDVIFATDNGTPYTVRWKEQTIDLSSYVGWAPGDAQVTGYNSGITTDKKVTSSATYADLKDDPDWYAVQQAYSRYNHDSAVRTINSLPDTSAYLATQTSGTNTIKFKGVAGSMTDGGAINTLTEEEIAVATAKGWTVTLV